VRVLVAEPLAKEGLEQLRAEHEVDVRTDLTRDQFLAALPDYEALVVRSQVKVDDEAFRAGTNLVVVGRAGVGVDNIDLDAATRAGVAVVNAPTANTIAAAEHTVGLIYALARRIPAADASLRAGEWKRAAFVGQELRGRTLGIVGLGKIGLAVAERARAMEMDLLAMDPFVTADAAAQRGIALVELDDLIARSDVITPPRPAHAQDQGHDRREAAGADEARDVRDQRRSRGLIDEAALAEALGAGTIGGAAVDVFESEPPTGSPLLTAPNTVLTPHLGASTEEAQAKVAEEVVSQMLDVLGGRSARYVVNAPLMPPETAQALMPFLPLARTLGQFYAQMAPNLNGLELEVAGDIAGHDPAPLVATTLAGLLEMATEERVTAVNAPLLAKERGLKLSARVTAEAPRHGSLLTLRGSADGSLIVAGTATAGEQRIARIGDYWVDMAPAPWML
jgi:D-3-phosphoglycerate dehydrogenase